MTLVKLIFLNSNFPYMSGCLSSLLFMIFGNDYFYGELILMAYASVSFKFRLLYGNDIIKFETDLLLEIYSFLLPLYQSLFIPTNLIFS